MNRYIKGDNEKWNIKKDDLKKWTNCSWNVWKKQSYNHSLCYIIYEIYSFKSSFRETLL